MTELALRPATVRTGLDFSLEGFLLSREAMRCTPKTLEHYRYTLGSFTEYLADQDIHDVADITPHDIRAYLVGLQHRGLKDTTQHIHARGIRAWLNWLVDEGELDISPMKRVAMHRLEKRIPPPFSPREVQTLLAACDQRTVLGARNYAIILTLLDTGLRARADKQVYELRIGGAAIRET
jgi:integrase/recombinase XerD